MLLDIITSSRMKFASFHGVDLFITGYDPEEYQEVVERHNRIDNERRKQKQELKETKRIEDEVMAKKKAEKEKIKRAKRREESKIKANGKSSAESKTKKEGDDSVSEDSGSDSDSDSDSDYDRCTFLHLTPHGSTPHYTFYASLTTSH